MLGLLAHTPARVSAHGRASGGDGESDGDEERAIELRQGCGGELARPASETTGRQRTDLFAEGDGAQWEYAASYTPSSAAPDG
jgi:hypothetical protein